MSAGRYSYDDNFQQTPFAQATGITPRQSTSGIFQTNDQLVSNRAHSVVANVNHSFNSTMTNNFVFNFVDFSNVIDPATVGFPEIRILGSQLWKSGTNYITPQSTFQERYQLRDDLDEDLGQSHFPFRHGLRTDFDQRAVRIRQAGSYSPLRSEHSRGAPGAHDRSRVSCLSCPRHFDGHRQRHFALRFGR
jgi:hypothetical protein